MITDSKQKKSSELTSRNKIQTLRREALTVLYAKEAANDRQVKAFREVVLRNELLKLEKVPSWINRQVKEEANRQEQSSRDVKYAVPNPLSKGSWDVHQTVALGNTLNWLATIMEDLSGEYTWTEARATVFVLTGITPPVHNCIIRHTGRSSLSSANRIELSLDPALTDKEVAAIYRQARRRILKQDKQGKARFRQLSEKHLRLAIFNAEQEGTFLKKMYAWNKCFPKWKYEHLSNFIRDCKKAAQRLMQPDYFDWKGVL